VNPLLLLPLALEGPLELFVWLLIVIVIVAVALAVARRL
jgi:hypothetical protein